MPDHNHGGGTSAWDWLKIGLIVVGAVVAYSTFTQNGWDCWTDYCKAHRAEQAYVTPRPVVIPAPASSYVTPPASADDGIMEIGDGRRRHRQGNFGPRGRIVDSGICRPCPPGWFRRPIASTPNQPHGECNCSR